MGDLSWESMVDQVCVKGRPGRLTAAAQSFEACFSNADSVTQSLRDGISDLETWRGDAGKAYRERLEQIAKAIDDIRESHRPVVTMLHDASSDLASAQGDMPIPNEMLDEVQGHQAEADRFRASVFAGMVGGLPAALIPGSFWEKVSDNWLGDLASNVVGWATDRLRSWFTDVEDDAQQVYERVDSAFDGHDLLTPNPTPTMGDRGDHNGFDPTSVDAGGGTGSAGSLGPGGAPKPPPMPNTGVPDDVPTPHIETPTPTLPTEGPPTTTPGLPTIDTGTGGNLPGTGLASGGPGFGPVGAGLGGAAGGGGLGSLGAGAGIGRPVSPAAALSGMPMGMAGGGAGGRGGGRGGRGAGRGGAGRGTGMMGGGHGAGQGGGDERNTWLTEDDDVWGAENSAAPGVIGG